MKFSEASKELRDCAENLVEHYESDILIDLDVIKAMTDAKIPYIRLIGFRACGVDSTEIIRIKKQDDESPDYGADSYYRKVSEVRVAEDGDITIKDIGTDGCSLREWFAKYDRLPLYKRHPAFQVMNCFTQSFAAVMGSDDLHEMNVFGTLYYTFIRENYSDMYELLYSLSDGMQNLPMAVHILTQIILSEVPAEDMRRYCRIREIDSLISEAA